MKRIDAISAVMLAELLVYQLKEEQQQLEDGPWGDDFLAGYLHACHQVASTIRQGCEREFNMEVAEFLIDVANRDA